MKLLVKSPTTTWLIRASSPSRIGHADSKLRVETNVVKIITRIFGDTGGVVAGDGVCNDSS
eukprot:914976-Heterocapsa_arctica.AAC.1